MNIDLNFSPEYNRFIALLLSLCSSNILKAYFRNTNNITDYYKRIFIFSL